MAEHAQTRAAGGESCCAPQDTLVAYWGALGAGADGLAITLQLTADGIPVCFGGATLAQSCGDPAASPRSHGRTCADSTPARCSGRPRSTSAISPRARATIRLGKA